MNLLDSRIKAIEKTKAPEERNIKTRIVKS